MLRYGLILSSDDLAFFAVLATCRSLAEAARSLNITPSAVTQRLQALEARAGVRLMDRSTRRLGLTDDGAMVATHAAMVGNAIAALADDLQNRSNIVSGNLRIAAPHGFGRVYVAPVVAAFARAHPRVTVSLELLDYPGSAQADGHDLIVHIGRPGPLDAIVTTLAENRRFLCATQEYLDSAPPIGSPDDLVHHRCIALRENAEDVTLWSFQRSMDETATVRIAPTMSSNDGAVAREWALAGLGVVIRSEWDVAGELATSRLRRLLPDWELPSADVVAILGSRHGRSARTAALLTMLRQSFAPPPWR